MRRPFGTELGTGTQPAPFAERLESFLNKALAGPFNGRHACPYGFRNLFISQLLVGFEQNPGTREFAPARFSVATQS
jgi:hypothetical protein